MAKRKDDEGRTGGARDAQSTGDKERESGASRAKDGDDEPRIVAVREKIGEAPDNLRRRGEWYRRRTGGSEG